MSTAIKTSPIAMPSSSFGQQTPALIHTSKRLYSQDCTSSSSPLHDILATPNDADRYPRGARNMKNGGAPQRRSVRVRAHSPDDRRSSPHLIDAASSSVAIDEDDPNFSAPVMRPRNLRRLSQQGRDSDVDFTAPASGARGKVAARAALASSARQPPSSSDACSVSSSTLALARAHGITVDQFELAKQQVMRFLHNDASFSPSSADDKLLSEAASSLVQQSNSAANFADLMTTPVHSQASFAPTLPLPARAARSRTTSAAPTTLGKRARTESFVSVSEVGAFDGGEEEEDDEDEEEGEEVRSTIPKLQSRSSFEDTVQRSQRRNGEGEESRESQVRKWAQEDSSSSEEDEGTHLRPVPRGVESSTARALASSQGSNGTLLPSPSFASLPHAAATSPLGAAPLARRGTMERFMTDRTPAAVSEESQDRGNDSASRRRVRASPPSSPARSRALGSTMSPPRRMNALSSSNHMMTSPAPSRPGAGLLFSPDIAQLLRSELDELEANEKRHSPRKPRAAAARANKIMTVDELSSPLSEDLTPLSSASSNRSRDVFMAEASPLKGGSLDVLSPSPSIASLRAPSFCDSSPPMSDKASTAGGSNQGCNNAFGAAAHPASAPDLLFQGLPSSSPTSSQGSQASEYLPRARGHRSSPGPMSHQLSSASYSGTTGPTSSANATDLGVRKRGGPLIKRNDSSPAIVSADGYVKPHWSYAALIGQAIFSTEDRKISLADVYSYIMECYPYYKKEDAGWQNSIRHNLSLNECFIKTARGANNPGKGCLWAIAPGCEDQFADGGFTKKSGSGSHRRARNSKASAASGSSQVDRSADYSSSSPLIPSASIKRARDDSPAASSTRHIAQGNSASRDSAVRASSSSVVEPARSLSPAVEIAPPATSTRPVAMARSQSVLMTSEIQPKPKLARRGSMDVAVLSKPASSSAGPQEKKFRLDAPYEHRRAASPPSAFHDPRRPLLPAIAASPPTSVYHRLAGPYQPISFTPNTSTNHRALALLASPEAAGIMPANFASRSVHHPISSLNADPEDEGAPFLPAPQIFPRHPSASASVTATRVRPRSNSSDKEEREPSTMLSPTTIVHTQSPVSSIRGGGAARAPMSPLQTSDDKFTTFADPEKKRLPGMRHIPAVAALAQSASDESFRSPPPHSTRHVRSPSGRALQSAGGIFQSALLSTPLAGRGVRTPWGASPGVNASGGNAGWGFDDSIEAELERFGGGPSDSVQTSGGSSVMPRLYWPSPSHPSSSTNKSHIAW